MGSVAVPDSDFINWSFRTQNLVKIDFSSRSSSNEVAELIFLLSKILRINGKVIQSGLLEIPVFKIKSFVKF